MTAPFRDLGNITDSGNDKKWDYHEQMAKYQMDDSEISQKKEMTRLLMAKCLTERTWYISSRTT